MARSKYRQKQDLGIEERDGTYTIAPYKQAREHKGWVVDTERAETFPASTTIEEVVRRTVELVQASQEQ